MAQGEWSSLTEVENEMSWRKQKNPCTIVPSYSIKTMEVRDASLHTSPFSTSEIPVCTPCPIALLPLAPAADTVQISSNVAQLEIIKTRRKPKSNTCWNQAAELTMFVVNVLPPYPDCLPCAMMTTKSSTL